MLLLLQAYRGFAAILVVLFHCAGSTKELIGDNPFVSFFGFGGQAGVQFFFVLSGFLMWHLHRDSVGERALRTYVKKRAIRIYPLYALITLAFVPIWWFTSAGEPYHKELGALLKSLLFIPQDHQPHIEVGWTLIHEVMFYCVFGVVVINRAAGFWLLGIWFAAVAIANGITGFQFARIPAYLFSMNNLLFGVGIIAAMAKPAKGLSSFIAANLAFVATAIAFNHTSATPSTQAAFVVAFGAAAFLIIIHARSPRVQQLFKGHPVLQLLGDASYAIYLTHIAGISVAFKLMALLSLALPPTVALLAASTFAVLVGIAVHVAVELPMLEVLRGSRISVLRLSPARWLRSQAHEPHRRQPADQPVPPASASCGLRPASSSPAHPASWRDQATDSKRSAR